MTVRPDQPGQLSDLVPGHYQIRTTPASGAPAEIDVDIRAGELLVVRADAGSGAALQLSIVDRVHETPGIAVSDRALRDLPSGSGVWGLVDVAAPFVITDRIDAGGLSLGTPARVGGRAASWTSTAMTVDGVQVGRGTGGPDQFVWPPDLINVETVNTSFGGTAADNSTPGATIALLARRPGSTRQRAVDASFTLPAMTGTNGSAGVPSIARVDSWGSASVQSGGPIAARAGLFASGSAAMLREFERDRPALVSSNFTSGFAHLVANPGDRMQVRLLGAAEHARRPYTFWPVRTADVTERDVFVQIQAAFEQQSSSGRRLEARAGYQHAAFAPSSDMPVQMTIDRVRDGVVPPVAADGAAARAEGHVAVALPPIRRHTIEAGLSAARSTSSSTTVGPASVAEIVSGLPARVWGSNLPAASSYRGITHVAAYLQDRIQARDNLTLDAGVRITHSSGAAAGAAQSISWTAVQPRLNLRWARTPFSFFVGYGRYQDELPLALLAFGDPGEPTRDVYRWEDRNSNRAFEGEERGVLVARGGRGPAVASIDPALASPRTDEFRFGAERTIGPYSALRASGVVRRERSLVRSVNVGAPLSSYSTRTIADQGEDWDSPSDNRALVVFDRQPSSFGKDQFLLTNSWSDDTASYDGIEIAWWMNTPRWWSFAGASTYRAQGAAANPGFRSEENDQGVIGALLENPNANTYPRGRLFFDRAYVLKWAIGYDGPHEFRAAVVSRYQDGQPFSRLVVVPDLAQGPDVVTAYLSGRTRFTFTTTVDARIEKGFALGGRRAAVRLELYNLLNLGLEVEENPLTGADFRRTTAVQPPFTARLGFRIEF